MNINFRIKLTLLAFAAMTLSPLVHAAQEKELPQVLFKNVNIFNGTENKLYQNHHVLVEGNLIKTISADEIDSKANATVINGGGKTLMPGLIDGHAHVMINADYGAVEGDMDLGDLNIRAVRVMERFLMDGFTSVRDMGGPAFALKRNIDNGRIPGPRLYPAGAFISQTSGHGDFRDRGDGGFSINDAGDLSNFERMGIGMVADGVPAVLKAVRLNLRNGATQIKIHGRRRRVVAFRSDRYDTVFQRRSLCRGRGGCRLGHLCGCPCVHRSGGQPPARLRCQNLRSRLFSSAKKPCNALPRQAATWCRKCGVFPPIWPRTH